MTSIHTQQEVTTMNELTDEQHSARKKLNAALADFEQDRDEIANPYGDDRRRVPEIEDAARAFLATLDPKPAPHGLTDEQVEALREADFSLQDSDLRAAFPEVFTPEPHPWNEADLQPGDVAVHKRHGSQQTMPLPDARSIAYWRRVWNQDSANITDWQVLRPTWTDKEN